MKLIFIIFLLIVSSACSKLSKPVNDFSKVGTLTSQDYIDHLAYLGDSYLLFIQDRRIELSEKSRKYLNDIHDRIIKNNEIFLPKREKPSFYLIKHTTPFIFSLPNSQYFISSALLKRFLKNEQMFVAALSREIIRSQRNLYEKNTVLMTGNISTEKIFQLLRLTPQVKSSLNEWSFVVLRRTGFDASALLAWIQLQNKNPLEFSLYSGDKATSSREEYSFKNFLVKEKKINTELAFADADEKNSSKEFYKMLGEIRE